MHLLSMIERYLRNSGVAPTRFGRDAVNDPRFVLDLRNGREPRASTAERVISYIVRSNAQGAR